MDIDFPLNTLSNPAAMDYSRAYTIANNYFRNLTNIFSEMTVTISQRQHPKISSWVQLTVQNTEGFQFIFRLDNKKT